MNQFITLNTIMGNGKSYQIPMYQRDYSWDKEDWEDLWNDILELPQDRTHYLGYLVLQQMNETEETFWVIDGQQRLTTVSLIALAIIALLKKWSEQGIEQDNNKIRYEKEIERYLGNFSTSKLTLSPKLTLNRNNNDFYKSWMLNFRQPPSLSKLKPSTKLMQQAFNFYYQKIEEMFDTQKSGAELTDFLEKTIGNGLVFTTISVQNDLDAFKVFETLNARGVKLSPADLLKNYLFSQVSKSSQLELDESERRWQNINDTLRNNEISTYLRHYWNSKYKLKRQPELFKALKKEISESGNPAIRAFDLLSDLEYQVVYYSAFGNPSDDLWNKSERKYLKVLNLLEVTTCYSLMLAALHKLNRLHFEVILRELVQITLRYNLSGLNPNEAERLFSEVANRISNNELTDPRSIALALKPIYVPNDNFEIAFSSLSISTRRKKDLVKYLLISIENQISNSDYQFEDASSTIEHILPENPGIIWEDNFPPDIQEEFIYRVGNYTLLSASVNNKLNNEMSFSDKLKQYEQSKYKLSNEYCQYDKFTPEIIQLRQDQMAKVAKGIWKSSFIV